MTKGMVIAVRRIRCVQLNSCRKQLRTQLNNDHIHESSKVSTYNGGAINSPVAQLYRFPRYTYCAMYKNQGAWTQDMPDKTNNQGVFGATFHTEHKSLFRRSLCNGQTSDRRLHSCIWFNYTNARRFSVEQTLNEMKLSSDFE